MPKNWREIEWNIFWLREILFISLPILFAVFTLPRGDYIHPVRLAVLLAILFALTVVNVLWTVLSAGFTNRTHRGSTPLNPS